MYFYNEMRGVAQTYYSHHTISVTVYGLASLCVRRDGVDSLYYVHPDQSPFVHFN